MQENSKIESMNRVGSKHYSKKKGDKAYYAMSDWSRLLRNKGLEHVEEMSDKEYLNLRSMSGTLHFQHLLCLETLKSTRTSKVDGERVYTAEAKPVGVSLLSDVDISVPQIEAVKTKKSRSNKNVFLDLEKDITYIDIKAKEPFMLTHYEFMFLLIRPEYSGYLSLNDDPYGVYLSVLSRDIFKEEGRLNNVTFKADDGTVKVKLPTPTINFSKNKDGYTTKGSSLIIDLEGFISPGYEKFEALLTKPRRKLKSSSKESEAKVYSSSILALQKLLFTRDSKFPNINNDEDLTELGKSILKEMPEKQKKNLGSHSNSLYLLEVLNYKGHYSDITVGVKLISDIEIQIPNIDVSKDQDTGINPEKDLTHVLVHAKEEFYLTVIEFMYLLLRDEYIGYCEVKGKGKMIPLKFNVNKYLKGLKQLPIPIVNVEIYEQKRVDISDQINGVTTIFPEYREKFGYIEAK